MTITFTRAPWKKPVPLPEIVVPPIPEKNVETIVEPIRVSTKDHDDDDDESKTIFKLDDFQFYCIIGLQLLYIFLLFMKKQTYFV